MSERKSQILDAAIDYIVQHGMADLSLRPLAEAIGTSARLLIFHFKSKDGLIAAVLEEIQARLRVSLMAVPAGVLGQPETSPMKQFWRWAITPTNLPYLRLLHEVNAIALQNPAAFGPALATASQGWIELIQSRLPSEIRNPVTATLCVAVFDGLMLELMATGDALRAEQSLDLFIDMLMHERQRRMQA
ncbi:MAG: TetR/AcrR family transcriptional regulator [Burkholderiales bacterium]|nr:TetR/AcrR family transcriptional regulator [Burkholderiales bacterium]